MLFSLVKSRRWQDGEVRLLLLHPRRSGKRTNDLTITPQ
jgi:hypothetical protein